jgi:hypothetical protein
MIDASVSMLIPPERADEESEIYVKDGQETLEFLFGTGAYV